MMNFWIEIKLVIISSKPLGDKHIWGREVRFTARWDRIERYIAREHMIKQSIRTKEETVDTISPIKEHESILIA